MYFSYLMLRNLVPGTMAPGEQRMADEQLGRIAAALTRVTGRIAARDHVEACMTEHGLGDYAVKPASRAGRVRA